MANSPCIIFTAAMSRLFQKRFLNRPSVYSPNVLCIQTEEKEEAFPLKWSVLTAVTNSAG